MKSEFNNSRINGSELVSENQRIEMWTKRISFRNDCIKKKTFFHVVFFHFIGSYVLCHSNLFTKSTKYTFKKNHTKRESTTANVTHFQLTKMCIKKTQQNEYEQRKNKSFHFFSYLREVNFFSMYD